MHAWRYTGGRKCECTSIFGGFDEAIAELEAEVSGI